MRGGDGGGGGRLTRGSGAGAFAGRSWPHVLSAHLPSAPASRPTHSSHTGCHPHPHPHPPNKTHGRRARVKGEIPAAENARPQHARRPGIETSARRPRGLQSTPGGEALPSNMREESLDPIVAQRRLPDPNHSAAPPCRRRALLTAAPPQSPQSAFRAASGPVSPAVKPARSERALVPSHFLSLPLSHVISLFQLQINDINLPKTRCSPLPQIPLLYLVIKDGEAQVIEKVELPLFASLLQLQRQPQLF